MSNEAPVRDRTTVRRFFVDNAILDEYGAELGPYGIAVYVVLVKHAGIDSQKCWPKYETIAKMAGMGVTKVKEEVAKLKRLGLISVKGRKEGDFQTSNLYTLLNVPSRVATTRESCGDSTDSRVATTNNPKNEQSSRDYYPEQSSSVRESGKDLEPSESEWSQPDNEGQRQFLAVVGAKTFERGQKANVGKILAAIAKGDALGATVFSVAAAELESMDRLDVDRLPPIPRNWFDFRAKQAREYQWSRKTFINALLNRDRLMEHLRYHMRGRSQAGQGGAIDYSDYFEDLIAFQKGDRVPAEGAGY